MSLKPRKPLNRFLKWIGAYTLSDESLAYSEIFEELPSAEREILNRIYRKEQTIEEAGRQMGLTNAEAQELYRQASENVQASVQIREQELAS